MVQKKKFKKAKTKTLEQELLGIAEIVRQSLPEHSVASLDLAVFAHSPTHKYILYKVWISSTSEFYNFNSWNELLAWFENRGWEEKIQSSDFMKLAPGSDEWQEYWRTHPEEQGAMVAWREEVLSK
ncbi:MAG: hypothetical protein WC479_07285 [Candidatus Izemoplasmatales bacterium]